MDWVGWWVACYLLWIAPIVLCCWIAVRWNRSWPFWLLVSFFLGIFALAILGVTIGIAGRGRDLPSPYPAPDLRRPS